MTRPVAKYSYLGHFSQTLQPSFNSGISAASLRKLLLVTIGKARVCGHITTEDPKCEIRYSLQW